MSAAEELTGALLAVVRGVPGLRPATPPTMPTASWVPWDWDGLAIDLGEEVVEVRIVATRLPLPPLLRTAEEGLIAVLRGSALSSALLRIVVTDIDAVALAGETGATSPGP